MTQKVGQRGSLPSPLMRGNWVLALACGHLWAFTLTDPLQAGEALADFWAWYWDPNCKTITPDIRHLPKEVDCIHCDRPKTYLGFDFMKDV